MIKQTNLIKRLKSLGLNSWGNKSAYTTFSHSGGRTHIGPVAEFFNRATSLAEEAAEAIEKLEDECETLREENKELKEKLSRAKNFNYPMASKYGGEDW